jgi:malate dehydrogenase (oxaloacetate-decarboxylating)
MNPLQYHKQLKGKIEITPRANIETKEELALAYTPGVAEPCKEIATDVELAYEYTRKGNLVAVISDGSAVLGLGNIGPEASLPVMEGKCVLFKKFGGVDAVPIVLATQDVDEIVQTIINIAPGFGGINLEDIAAPRCFEVEKRLQEKLSIPIFHDDQHGTAIVVLAGLYNALRVVNKDITTVKVVINGAGAAGNAIAQLLLEAGVQDLVVLDSKGCLVVGRDDMDEEKTKLAARTNPRGIRGGLAEAAVGADMLVGVSKAGLFTTEMIQSMNSGAIVFALANPTPEILPLEALAAGAAVAASGRSDFANQINNALVFPGLFRGLLDARIVRVTDEMQIAVARAIASCVESPTAEMIIPSIFDERVAQSIARSVREYENK